MVLVSGQNLKISVVSILVATQVTIVAYFMYAKLKLKRSVFDSWLSFLSYTFLIAVISILSFIGFYLQEWHTEEWIQTRNATNDNREISQEVSIVVIILILLSILLELLKGVVSTYQSFKAKQRK
jgi:NO-binding membrane sensor protein with MHYT domain